MLVLARKVGERLHIGNDIEVVVVEIKGDVVRLGIAAPRGVAIFRHEIYAAIQGENLAASALPNDLNLSAKLNLQKGAPNPKVQLPPVDK
ncbi:MAG: carbon storage regulator CsrA [Peptococcaceae bacterium]|nr:carbon storage regulator CsrA [Peptococcaceae bacterium]